jgi:hypothetical protein
VEGAPLGEGGIFRVHFGGQHHLHGLEVLLSDHDSGLLPHLQGVLVHHLLGEAIEVILVDVIDLLGDLSGLFELGHQLLPRVCKEGAPRNEGVEVRDILIEVEGSVVDGDEAKLRQVEEAEG